MAIFHYDQFSTPFFDMPRRISLRLMLIAAVACTPPRANEPANRTSTNPVLSAGPAWGGLRIREVGPVRSQYTLVLMHGYGASGDDLVPLAEQLADNASIHVVVPEAPLAVDNGRAWFHIDGGTRDPQEVHAARRAVLGIISTLAARGTPSSQVILGGFSQGAMMSADVAIEESLPLRGLVLWSGGAFPFWPAQASPRENFSVFVSHGRRDPVLPYANAAAIATRFERAGAQVEFVAFDGVHSIPDQVVASTTRFLRGL